MHISAPRRRPRPRLPLARLFAHLVLGLLSAACLMPLILILSASFSDEVALIKDGYSFWPSDWSLLAYRYLLGEPGQILRAYMITTVVTVFGTAAGLLMMALIAYPLSRRSFAFRGPISFLLLFTMLFNGGLIPFYILMTRYLRLTDTIWALILPGLVNVFWIIILRTYFAQLPDELFDAARIDGAGEWRIFFQVVLPLSTPALATIGFFTAIGYWNNWQNALFFIRDQELVPLQFLLYRIFNDIEQIRTNPDFVTANIQVPTQPLRMAMAILATGPAALAFLFAQRYLVRGITVGSFK